MADAKKSPAKKAAKGKAAPKKAAAKKPAAKKPAPKKAAAKKVAPRKAVAKKAAAKKPAARKPAPKKKTSPKKAAARKAAPKKAAGTTGAEAPRDTASRSGEYAGPGKESSNRGFEDMKPKIAAAADAIESTVTDFIDKADVRDFPDKLWRLLAMIAFAFVGYWVFIATVILAAMQWVVVLLGDKPSPEIEHYMKRCSDYIIQVLDLLAYRSEALPWPLGPLPGEEQVGDTASE